jgi:predicted nicotinamide N-methyase
MVQRIAQRMHDEKSLGETNSPPSLQQLCARFVWMHECAFRSSVASPPGFAQLLPRQLLRLIESSGEVQRSSTQWMGQHYPERLYFFGGRFLHIHQQQRVLHGGLIWHSAPLLCEYLQQCERRAPGCWSGKRVIELGAGPALVGLLAKHFGAAVTISDLGQHLNLIRRNILSNWPTSNWPTTVEGNSSTSTGTSTSTITSTGTSTGTSTSIGTGTGTSTSTSKRFGAGAGGAVGAVEVDTGRVHDVHVAELEWGNPQHIAAVLADHSGGGADDTRESFDVVLGSDILYMAEAVEPLIETLLALSGPRTKIILAYQQHLCTEASSFFDIIRTQRLFSLTEVPVPVCLQADSSVKYGLCELQRIFYKAAN